MPAVLEIRPSPTVDDPRAARAREYRRVRAVTESLCAPLEIEDYVIQGAPEASPPKWHLAHTTWFFETFLLAAFAPGYRLHDARYPRLFNSYYHSVGTPPPREARGLSRPTLREVFRYRRAVDEAVLRLLERQGHDPKPGRILEWGLQHEQQHQELLLMDVLRNFSVNPLRPACHPPEPHAAEEGPASGTAWPGESVRWAVFDGGLRGIGHAGDGFAFDNEGPRHRAHLAPYALADRLVTCGEYLAFIEDGGYARPELWLSDGWETRMRHGWEAPLYWERDAGSWRRFSLRGLLPLEPAAPVIHASFYEADAFARWAGARLPTEAEWENAAGEGSEWSASLAGANLLENAAWDARPARDLPGGGLRQMAGDAWEWTQSAYAPYPGYRPPEGALGEYNGKFMNNQRVLRGGSFATPRAHLRPTYRNFYRPEDRWAFTGFRLCKDSATP